jgi:hypothetical protein
MDSVESGLRDITEIRSMMERSSKFLSLSGLSGISAGIVAMLGAAIAWSDFSAYGETHPPLAWASSVFLVDPTWDHIGSVVSVALVVLVVGIGLSIFFSIRMARKHDLPVWSPTTKHLILDLALPLGAGGILTAILISYGLIVLAPATTLVFYGLALLNASRYTVGEIRIIAIAELLLGLLAAGWPAIGLLFWATGFGLLHIIYGIALYRKYER